MRKEITTNIGEMIDKVREVTDIPCAVGFGISTPEQAKEMAAFFGWCNCRIGDCKDCSRAWNGLCAICKRVCEEDESGCGGSVKDRDKAIK